MSKQQYRSEVGVISEILQVVMDCGRQGMMISSIARRANLSHHTSIKKCQKLINFGLIESAFNGKNRTFTITEKGIHLFQEIQKFLEIVKVVKIRY